MRERASDDLRLLMDLLRHEMAVIALVDQESGGVGPDPAPLDGKARRIAKRRRSARQGHEIAILEIGDGVGEGRERQRVGAKEHFAGAIAFAKADCERRALARADQQIRLALEDHGEGESAFEPRQAGGDRVDRRKSLVESFASRDGR